MMKLKSGKMRSEEKMDKTKILVVDDESRMRKLVKDFLVDVYKRQRLCCVRWERHCSLAIKN